MSDRGKWQERYENDETPWDSGEPDGNLMVFIETSVIAPVKTLEIGCGTGTNSIYLAKKGFDVTGVDISDIPVQKAIEEAKKENLNCRFLEVNFLVENVGSDFGFMYDRGCFHTMDSDEDRQKFAKKVHEHLSIDGYWLSLIGSCDDAPRETGPPMLSAKNIVDAVERHFEILSLTTGEIDTAREFSPKAWVCLMKKRNI
ncbi:MAG: class I SAM-dependent methyltransferase [Deltaproteobacteria bacterium]|nr:class I SAM-dependent methyltransferase [Deltaproteobacteria bacterium]